MLSWRKHPLWITLFLFFLYQTTARASPDNLNQYMSARVGPASEGIGCLLMMSRIGDRGCTAVSELLQVTRRVALENSGVVFDFYQKELQKIESKESYQYFPILFAAMTEDKRFVPELKRISALESKLALSFPYSKIALDRIQHGKCEKQKSTIKQFAEICLYEDPWIKRFLKLGQK